MQVLFFTLLGIAITNHAADRRHQAQLAHDQEAKARDRDLVLRKEIYLAASEAIQAGLNAISNFCNLEMPLGQVARDYVDKSPALAKIHVVATVPTAKAMASLNDYIGSSLLELTLVRAPCESVRVDLDLLKSQLSDIQKSVDRWLEEMRQSNLVAAADEHRRNIVKRNFDFDQKRFQETAAKQRQAYKDLGKSTSI